MNLEQRIRELAHRLWEEEGRPSGKHDEHWERARLEIETNHNSMTGGAGGTPGNDATGAASGKGAEGQPSQGDRAKVTGVTSSTGLVGADDTYGGPRTMGVDDLNVIGALSDPKDTWPTTGRSKLVGS